MIYTVWLTVQVLANGWEANGEETEETADNRQLNYAQFRRVLANLIVGIALQKKKTESKQPNTRKVYFSGGGSGELSPIYPFSCELWNAPTAVQNFKRMRVACL